MSRKSGSKKAIENDLKKGIKKRLTYGVSPFFIGVAEEGLEPPTRGL